MSNLKSNDDFLILKNVGGTSGQTRISDNMGIMLIFFIQFSIQTLGGRRRKMPVEINKPVI